MCRFLLFFIITMSLTVASLNVRGVGSTYRRSAILQHLKGLKCDIILLQECALKWPPKSNEWSFDPSVWSVRGESKNEGLGILIKNNLIKLTSHTVLVPGRLLLCNLEFMGHKIRLFNAYAPTDLCQRNNFINTLNFYLPGRCSTVIAGDFNLIRRTEDRQGESTSKLDSSSHAFNSMFSDFRLRDSCREVHGKKTLLQFFSPIKDRLNPE